MTPENSFAIFDHFPIRWRNPGEQDYLNYLWRNFETASQPELDSYGLASFAWHMLFMAAVYQYIFRIKLHLPERFSDCISLLDSERRKESQDATSPFGFWKLDECRSLRLFKLVGDRNGEIGEISKWVDERNKKAHANGVLPQIDQGGLEKEIDKRLEGLEMLRNWLSPHFSPSIDARFGVIPVRLTEGEHQVHFDAACLELRLSPADLRTYPATGLGKEKAKAFQKYCENTGIELAV